MIMGQLTWAEKGLMKLSCDPAKKMEKSARWPMGRYKESALLKTNK